jgi:hypothetical protein
MEAFCSISSFDAVTLSGCAGRFVFVPTQGIILTRTSFPGCYVRSHSFQSILLRIFMEHSPVWTQLKSNRSHLRREVRSKAFPADYRPSEYRTHLPRMRMVTHSQISCFKSRHLANTFFLRLFHLCPAVSAVVRVCVLSA